MSQSICFGICTYKNLDGLAKLLKSLDAMEYDENYQCRAVVVDNECSKESTQAIAKLCESISLKIEVVQEKQKGIPFARNASVKNALKQQDDFFFFLDDDEYVPVDYLQKFMNIWQETKADVITGPVIKEFSQECGQPSLQKAIKYDQRTAVCQNNEYIKIAYTNNTLVTAEVLKKVGATFHPAFRETGGSDFHYFKRVSLLGFSILWRTDCIIYEDIPNRRLNIAWFVKRKFRSGSGCTMTFLLLAPTLYTRWRCLVLFFRSLFAALKHFFVGIFTGKRDKLFLSLGSLFFGFGLLSGIFHLNYREYSVDYR